jgi:hypothetical protein
MNAIVMLYYGHRKGERKKKRKRGKKKPVYQ